MADVRIVADRAQRPRGRWDRKRSDIGTCTRKHVRGSAMAVCLTPHLPRFIPTPTIHSTRVHRPLEHGYTITIARNNPRHHCRRQLLRISNQAKAASLRAWQHLQHKDIMILFAVCFSLDNPPGPGKRRHACTCAYVCSRVSLSLACLHSCVRTKFGHACAHVHMLSLTHVYIQNPFPNTRHSKVLYTDAKAPT